MLTKLAKLLSLFSLLPLACLLSAQADDAPVGATHSASEKKGPLSNQVEAESRPKCKIMTST
jgi:hypothetical protein